MTVEDDTIQSMNVNMDKSKELIIHLIEEVGWEVLAVELIKHGYKVSLNQGGEYLHATRSWLYYKGTRSIE